MLLRPIGCAPAFGLTLLLSACFAQDPLGEVCDVGPGDLVITELMVNPIGRYDTDREWFEIFNAAGTERILDRLVIRRLRVRGEPPHAEVAKSHYVRLAGRLAADAYFVFGDGSAETAPIEYSYDDDDHPLGIGESLGALTNSVGGLELHCGETLVDRVRWGEDVNNDASEEGWSVGLDGALLPDAVRNDDGWRWCSGGGPFDADGNRGTPGMRNEVCP